MKTAIACLTKRAALLPQTRDCSCYMNGPVLTPTLLRLHRHTDMRLGSLTLPAPEAGDFMELIFLQIFRLHEKKIHLVRERSYT